MATPSPMTPNSPHWSGASPTCRIEWHPSRWLLAALILLSALAASALPASGLPAPLAWMLVPVVLACGLASARRHWRMPSGMVAIDAQRRVLVDGVAVAQPRLHWRGPLAVLSWRDVRGRTRHRTWWPDTLPPARRRELRLAADNLIPARATPQMAP
ncbi:hypothetical protein [Luteimonas sp. MC1572]|uniref:hypothetical protein n=2 Tax=Luteimonas sp. MC1572 TaxID=2799325 RepID=UPI001F3DC780|nr:hypothetical protein [Luteimonas sp. MC1572]